MVFKNSAGEWPAHDRRRTKRWPTLSTCALRGPSGEAAACTVRNISQGGFGAECSQALTDGDELTLRLGRIGYAPARVVWRTGSAVGCEFLRDVTAAEVALTLATATRAAKGETD